MKHQCRTYFYIHSEQEIDIEMLSKKLSLELVKKDANAVKIGFCDEYDVNINNMLRKTLKDLFGKEKVESKKIRPFSFIFLTSFILNKHLL